jgi:hypothetical protein
MLLNQWINAIPTNFLKSSPMSGIICFFIFYIKNLVNIFFEITLEKKVLKKSQFLCWKNGEILPEEKHCFVGCLIIRLTINGTIELMQPFSLVRKVYHMSYRISSSLGSINVLKFVEGVFINCSRPFWFWKEHLFRNLKTLYVTKEVTSIFFQMMCKKILGAIYWINFFFIEM